MIPTKGVGSTFDEALDDYIRKSEMSDSTVLGDFKDSLESSSPISPLYIGVNVKHTVHETLEYLKLFNSLNKKYLEMFMPFFPKSEFHTQVFKTSSNTPNPYTSCSPRRFDCDFENESKYDNEVLVLDEADDIVLQDHFHITLFFLGVDKKTEEQIREDVEKFAPYFEDKYPDFKLILNTLTLYEFSVCLMYRHLYKMTLPFEKPVSPQESQESSEMVTMRYLVLVPGVVFFSVVQFQKPLFAIPPKDFDATNEASESTRNTEKNQLDKFLSCLKGNVLIENYHSTHITLGTSKEYKAVISNQVCQSLFHFLETTEDTNVKFYTTLKSRPDQTAWTTDPNFNKELKDHLKVYNSGPCKYDNLKDVFLKFVPYLLSTPDSCTLKNLNETFTLENSQNKSQKGYHQGNHPNLLLGDKDLYSNTTLYVSDDFEWFYFNNLPATHTLHSDTSDERYDWNIDVYVVAFEKQVQGNVHFNQK